MTATMASEQHPQHSSTTASKSEVTTSRRETLLTARRGAILIVALRRPEVKNAFNDAMYLDLIDTLQDASFDETIAAVVLTGTGSYFSSGADLKETSQVLLSSMNESNDDISDGEGNGATKAFDMQRRPPGQFMMALLQFPKVIVAAVNGPAVGIGATLLFHCDIVVCTPQATFWTPFTRLALVPEFCSSVMLIETMGLSKANEMLLLGKKIDANTALAWNVVSQVIEISPGDDCYSNPFASSGSKSLAIQMCDQLQQHLLSLPLGSTTTSQLFVSMMRGSRRNRLIQVCQEELRLLNERFQRGDVLQAVSELSFGGQSKL